MVCPSYKAFVGTNFHQRTPMTHKTIPILNKFFSATRIQMMNILVFEIKIIIF